MIIAQFKDSDKSDKKSGVGKKIGGVALLGGSAAGLFGAKGIKLLKSDKPRNKRSKVKSYVRKGKLVQTFERLNPFYNKDKRSK